MKKLLLMMFLSGALMACSTDKDDEPAGGGSNQGTVTENSGWSVTYMEQISLKDGEPIILNTSNECLEWKEKYGENFSVSEYGDLRINSWKTNYPSYSFDEIDKLLTEYVSFTEGSFLSEGRDLYLAIALSQDKKSLYGCLINYSYIEGSDEYNESNWEAIYVSTYTDPYNNLNWNLPDDYVKWCENHKDNLTMDEEFDETVGFTRGWRFEPNNFNGDYVKNEIYPFISMSIYATLTNGVSIYQKGSDVIREFTYAGYE